MIADWILIKLNTIIIYGLITFLLSWFLYPLYIKFLKSQKAGKTIREEDVTGQKATIFQELHSHKAWTPTMGWGLFLIIVALMIIASYIPYKLWRINNTLLNRQETYILLFWFFGMGGIWVIDDILNIKSYSRIKWLNAKAKMWGMILFASFISYRFYGQLWVDRLFLWPWLKITIGFWFLPFSFLFVLFVTHAINITDGLDGLVWWMMSLVLWTLVVATFLNQTYIATSLLVIVIAILLSFLRFNINPAQVFMGDSGSFALWGVLSTLVLLLNMRMGIIVPFVILFLLFIVELLSSFFQIFWKKTLKRKLFPIAPLHHLWEYYWAKEHTVVMKFWMVQGILALVAMTIIIYNIAL